MATEQYTDEVKVRVPAAWRAALEAEASAENLNVSDIVRRAVRKLLGSKLAAKRK